MAQYYTLSLLYIIIHMMLRLQNYIQFMNIYTYITYFTYLQNHFTGVSQAELTIFLNFLPIYLQIYLTLLNIVQYITN
jgi:hypothetical protein